MSVIVKAAVACFVFLTACAGRIDYVPPAPRQIINFRLIEAPRDAVWNTLIPALSRQYFVINTIDRSSGLISVSYSGDPEKYVDCGMVASFVSNARGERTYSFPGARAEQRYELMNANGLFTIQRRMSLEGRANIVLEELGPRRTRVSVSTRYLVSWEHQAVRPTGQHAESDAETISFNSDGAASFAATGTTCRPTGTLEQEILQLGG